MSQSYLRCPTVRLVPVSLHAGPCCEGCKLRCASCYHSSRTPACRNRGMQDSAPSRGHCISHIRYVRGARHNCVSTKRMAGDHRVRYTEIAHVPIDLLHPLQSYLSPLVIRRCPHRLSLNPTDHHLYSYLPDLSADGEVATSCPKVEANRSAPPACARKRPSCRPKGPV